MSVAQQTVESPSEELGREAAGSENAESCEVPVADALHGLRREDFVQQDCHCAPLVLGRSVPTQDMARRILGPLHLQANSRVLQVGTGSGYLTAVVARVAHHVISIERLPTLAEIARSHFENLGITNVEVRQGNGLLGALDAAPFDAILVSTSSAGDLGELLNQLKQGGRLVTLEGPNRNNQKIIAITRTGENEFERHELGRLDFSREVGEILIEMGLVDPSDLEEAMRISRSRGTEALVELKRLIRINDTDLYRAMAQQRGIPSRK